MTSNSYIDPNLRFATILRYLPMRVIETVPIYRDVSHSFDGNVT